MDNDTLDSADTFWNNSLEGEEEDGGKSDTYMNHGLPAVITLSFFLVVSMVLALGGNTMVILTIARHRGMRTRTNLLLANLAVADILVAVLDMPVALITIIKGDWIFSDMLCDFNGFAVGLGLMLSVHTLMWISIHKYISITRPFARTFTPFKIVLMILAAWLWSIAFNLTPTPVIGWTDTVYKKGASQCGPPVPQKTMAYVHAAVNTSVNLIIPIIVMTCCYYRIFKEVKDHLSRMRDFTDVSVRSSMIQQKRITETLCIVLLLFLLFWMPYIIYSLSLVFRGQKAVAEIFNPISYLFGYMNSACNPIIYALRSPSFRRGFSEIICRDYRTPIITDRSHDGRGSINQGSNRRKGGMVSFRRSMWFRHSKKENRLSINGGKKESQRIVKYKETNNLPKRGRSSSTRSQPRHAPASQVLRTTENYPQNSKAATTEQYNNDLTVAVENQTVVNLESCNVDSVIVAAVKYEEGSMTDEEVREPLLCQGSKNNLLLVDGGSRSSDRQRHISFSSQASPRVTSQLLHSSSQPNMITYAQTTDGEWDAASLLPPPARVTSKSQQEIVLATTSIISEQVKAASAGDVRLSESPSQIRSPSKRRRHFSDRLCRKNALMWQPSVDKLYVSPHLGKRRYHRRKCIAGDKKTEPAGFSGGHRQRKISDIVVGGNMRLAALINTIRRSFSDLINEEDNGQVQITGLKLESPSCTFRSFEAASAKDLDR